MSDDVGDRAGPARGHDWTQTIRYRETTLPATGRIVYCHDDGRPIPPGARAYRRIDARQGYPLICLPCHEKLEHQRYRMVKPECICGEILHWAADSWHHEDESIWKMRWETCPHCGGREGGCRRCLNMGRIQERDHAATPREEREHDDHYTPEARDEARPEAAPRLPEGLPGAGVPAPRRAVPRHG